MQLAVRRNSISAEYVNLLRHGKGADSPLIEQEKRLFGPLSVNEFYGSFEKVHQLPNDETINRTASLTEQAPAMTGYRFGAFDPSESFQLRPECSNAPWQKAPLNSRAPESALNRDQFHRVYVPVVGLRLSTNVGMC